MKKWMKWAAGILALALVAVWAVPTLLGNGKATEAFAGYTQQVPKRGTLEVEVTGNGSVQAAQTKTLYAPVSAEIETVHVKEGELVSAGDAIAMLDDESLEEQIRAAKSALDNANRQLKSASLRKEERRLNAPTDGKVKLIAAKGADLSVVTDEFGALAYISKEEKMQVTLAAVRGVAVGDLLTLEGEYDTLQATVQQARNVQGNTVCIVEGDDWRIQRVSVVYQGQRVGDGLLLPNRGIPVLGSYGTIKKVDADENKEINSGARMYTLEEDYSEATLALFAAQQEAQRAYDAQCAKREELTVRAPFDGVVTALAMTEGDSVVEGRTLCTVQQSGAFEVVAAIDELDIALVEPGQSATVSMDAVKGGEFQATVLRKSAVGQYQGGVTTYDVTLGLAEHAGVMAGMSAEARIEVAQKEGALLLPKSIIAYRDGKPYVLTERGEVAVTLGLASADQVEILSGLSDGEVVLAKAEKAATGIAAMQQMRPQGGTNGGL